MIFDNAQIVKFFGLPEVAKTLERADLANKALTTHLASLYGGSLDRHRRHDVYHVNNCRQPFSATQLYLRTKLPFMQDDDTLEVITSSSSCGCGGCSGGPTHSCFSCHGDQLSAVYLDADLGKLTVMCPVDDTVYEVKYTAGFEKDANDLYILPPKLMDYAWCKLAGLYNQFCAGDDEKCKCGKEQTAVALQSDGILSRFLPQAYAPIQSRVLTP